jgi:hypothetical protein
LTPSAILTSRGLAYSFIKTLNIVEITIEKFLAIPNFGFFASSSAIVGSYGAMRG